MGPWRPFRFGRRCRLGPHVVNLTNRFDPPHGGIPGMTGGEHRGRYRKASDGTGREELLCADDQNKWPESWSPDGRFLLCTSTSLKQRYDIRALPLAAERAGAPLKPVPWLQTDVNEQHAPFSPDGR
jgi:hypothetical protein